MDRVAKATIPALAALLGLAALVGLAPQAAAAEVSVTGLEHDGATTPLGTDAARPRLGWRLTATRPGVSQSAYQVVVARSAAAAAAGTGEVWDSGRVERATPWAEYAGPALASHTRYFWAVRVWDERGEATPWARPTWLETAFMEPSEWRADWITRAGVERDANRCWWDRTTSSARENAECTPPSPIMRTEFDVRRPVRNARLYASGLGYGVFHLNARRVGDRELSPSFTDYADHVFYVSDDVTSLIRQGRNALGAELGRGFYAITQSDMGHAYDSAEWHDEPKLRLELHLTFADGSEEVVSSGPSWKAAAGPTIYDNLFRGETYDGARAAELGAWTSPGYDDTAWQPAARAAAPAGRLVAENQEPERVLERRRFKSVTERAPGVYVFDLGQNVSGWTEIRVRGKRGDAVRLLHGEKLRSDGRVEPPPGLEPSLIEPEQTDVYRLAGTDGDETYRPQFVFHGFQYVEVTGWPEGSAPTLDDLTAHVVNTDFRPVGSFESSHPLLNRIVRNTSWAIRQNAHGIPSDTPVYEKTGWTGDGQIMAPSWMWLFDVQRFYSKWSVDIDDAQGRDGALPEWAPATRTQLDRANVPESTDIPPMIFAGPSPGWDVALFSVPWDLHDYYGDERSLPGRYEAMKRYVTYAERFAPTGVFPMPGTGFGPPGLGDWATVSGAPKGAWPDANAWWYEMHRLLAGTAALLGREDEKRRYSDRAADIKRQYNELFLDRVAGRYWDPSEAALGYSQHLNAMSLALELVPAEHRQKVADGLAADVRARGNHLNTGMVGTRFLWPALSENGHLDEALAAATQTTYPSYGYWIDELGWTSLGEYWEESSRSRSHHFLGTIVQWLFEELVGITPRRPGFEEIEFRPEVPKSGLQWARASHDSPRGKVASSWRRTDRGLRVAVTVPPNSRGVVAIPAGSRDAVTAPAGADFRRFSDGRVVYQVGSGTYTFLAGS